MPPFTILENPSNLTAPLKPFVVYFNQLLGAACIRNLISFWNGSHDIPMQRPFFITKIIIT